YVGLGNFELDTGFVLAPSVVNISDSILEHNQARGGQDAAGNGADGWGGAIASLFAATTNVTGSTLANNHAIGDDGSSGGQGGNGFGGGAFNDPTSALTFTNSTVSENHANGGDGDGAGLDGQGIGGGVYNLGTLAVDVLTQVRKNHASTSDDDIFG